MKKILGIDLGTTSIGWCIAETSEEKKLNLLSQKIAETDINNDRIGLLRDAVGVRIIAQNSKNIESFNKGVKMNDIKGTSFTPTAERRKYRGARRMNNRYKHRRCKLNKLIKFIGIIPDAKYYTNEVGKRGENNDIGKAIYELRNRATKEKITLNELGRIFLHLNQLRGYSSDRFSKEEKSNSDYYTAEILEIDSVNIKQEFETGSQDKIKYLRIPIKIKTEEPINMSDDSEEKLESEFTGFIYKKENNFEVGQTIAIKKPELKQEKKGKQILTEYFKFSVVKADEKDWNFRYKTFDKTLTKWCEEGKTVGSYFYRHFYDESTPSEQKIERIRNRVVNRKWYEQEFDTIFYCQYNFHQEFFDSVNIEQIVQETFTDYEPILSDILKIDVTKEQLRCLIKDKIIFFQRPWQQAKNKGQCNFEKKLVTKEITEKGTGIKKKIIVQVGREVISRSHPLFQEFRIWKQINNLKLFLHDINGEKTDLFTDPTLFEQYIGKTIAIAKQLIFDQFQNQKTISWNVVANKVLGIQTVNEKSEIKKRSKNSTSNSITNSNEFFTVNFRKLKKDGTYGDTELSGNVTKITLQKILFFKEENWFDSAHIETKEAEKHGLEKKKKKELLKIEKQNNKELLRKDNLEEQTPSTQILPEVTNLQLLWEIIYDSTLQDVNKVAEVIKRQFGFEDDICDKLAHVKFTDQGMANISAKAIRQILPLMKNRTGLTKNAITKINSLISLNEIETQNDKEDEEKLVSLKDFIEDSRTRLKISNYKSINDFTYLSESEALAVIYGSHSTQNIIAMGEMQPVPQHSMNNPVVEKIVNEAISLINEIFETYGFDEVRIELSRELKSSMAERQQMWESMLENSKKNEWAKQMLRELKSEYKEVDPSSKSAIDKIRIIEDVVKYKSPNEFKEFKLKEPTTAEVKRYLMWLEQNFRCPYTNQFIPFVDVFSDDKRVEIEHIIPKERYYLDSYSNKVITWREINQEKASNGNRTAYEFIVSKRTKGEIKLANGQIVYLVSAEEWKNHVENMFPKGGKRTNLLRKEIPEDPINRTLNETRYINKKLKEKLSELVGSDKVWVTSGAVTDILRERWHLNNVMKELVKPRFENFKAGDSKYNIIDKSQIDKKSGKPLEIYPGFSKRLDHRHHALDAIIIACTKQQHIQYINTLNAINSSDKENTNAVKSKYKALKEEIVIGDSSKKFKTPWEESKFIPEVKNALEQVIVSHKNTRLLISPSKHRMGKEIKPQKIASLRGQLHLETNYAQKKYFIEGTQTTINKIVELILNNKFENQNQSLVHFKNYEEIIKALVLKEKYQRVLISLFEKYNSIQLTKQNCKDYTKSVLEEIRTQRLLIEKQTNTDLKWLSTFEQKKDKSSRPMGLSMDFNDARQLKSIADPRIKRLAEYRSTYIKAKIKEIENLSLEKKDKDEAISELKNIKLYSNAIYEVKIKDKCMVEIKDLIEADLSQIQYKDFKTTDKVRQKIEKIGLVQLKTHYISDPIFLSEIKLEVKKVRQISSFNNLYEIAKGKFVYSSDVFMTYFFVQNSENRRDSKREVEFLKFLDAVKIINTDKPTQIDYSKLMAKANSELIFTLAKNDLVYLPDEQLTDEQLEEIDWNDFKKIIPQLYIVKDMEKSNDKIIFQHFFKATEIEISESSSKNLIDKYQIKFKEKEEEISKDENEQPEKKSKKSKVLIEEIKYGTKPMMQRVIKVFSNKLGSKIVPYWMFPNGCWDNETAKKIGLLKS